MINIGFVWQDIRSFFLILIFGVKPQSLKLSFQQRSAVGIFLHLELVFILFFRIGLNNIPTVLLRYYSIPSRREIVVEQSCSSDTNVTFMTMRQSRWPLLLLHENLLPNLHSPTAANNKACVYITWLNVIYEDACLAVIIINGLFKDAFQTVEVYNGVVAFIRRYWENHKLL